MLNILALMGEPLCWSESFAVGHAALDAEHRHLLKLINQVIAAVNSRVDPATSIERLQQAAVNHMQHENLVLWQLMSGTHEVLAKRPKLGQLLKSIARKTLDEHLVEHRASFARLEVAIGEAKDSLIDELKGWFLDHALGYDARLKAIFQAAE